MSDRMNISSTLDKLFDQFNEIDFIGAMKSLQPSDRVGVLDVTMRRGGLGGKPIRHVPIIKPFDQKQPTRGKLKALISKIDVATLLSPPWNLIPKEVIDRGLINVSSLTAYVKSVSRQSIEVAFQEMFSGTPPQISYKSTLDVAMKLLTSTYDFDAEGVTKTRRYKTVPVFNEQSSLIGMLSYIDVFREIKKREDGHSSFLKKSSRQLLKEIEQQLEEIQTIGSDRCIFDAIGVFRSVSFTHLPVVTDGLVTGIIDDVIVYTYEHPAMISAFSSVPLSTLAVPINLAKNVVSLDDPLSVVIDRFLLNDRPTAVLVGDMKSEKFEMYGIISYLDILRNFKATFLSGGNNDHALKEE